jgi:hypothetical protein
MGIKGYFDRLGMACVTGADLLICRLCNISPGIPDPRPGHAFHLPECGLDTPETACRKRGCTELSGILHRDII